MDSKGILYEKVLLTITSLLKSHKMLSPVPLLVVYNTFFERVSEIEK